MSFGDEYDERWARLAAEGAAIHGEADLVASFAPSSVLDAGCGTGRVAIELARRGVDVVGVDRDARMIGSARRKAPELEWHERDLVGLDLGRTFDAVVMAGNVLLFVDAGTAASVVTAVAGHVAPGGRLVAGFQLRPPAPRLDEYDAWCAAAGLEREARFSTWEGAPFADGGDYAVSVHRRRG